MHALVLAVVLQPSPIEEWVDKTERTMMLPIAKEYWIAMGVMEKEEWYFNSIWSMEGDQELMEWRLKNTPPDAPTHLALHHLPDSSTAYNNYTDACLYSRFLESIREGLLDGDEKGILDAIQEDCQRRIEIWYQLYQCTGKYNGQDGRRLALHKLREMVGPDAFYSGVMPAHLPPSAYLSGWRALYEPVLEYP